MPTLKPTRRELLRVAAGLAGASVFRCGSADPVGTSDACVSPSSAPGRAYCLVEPLIVRVPGGAALGQNHAVLFNVDDNTAVIVARDERGLHALSAICTHACCVVSLCESPSCDALTTTPPACSSTPMAIADPMGQALLCPCHGSAFRMADGAALTGPAVTPLPALAVTVDGPDALVDTGRQVDVADRV